MGSVEGVEKEVGGEEGDSSVVTRDAPVWAPQPKRVRTPGGGVKLGERARTEATSGEGWGKGGGWAEGRAKEVQLPTVDAAWWEV